MLSCTVCMLIVHWFISCVSQGNVVVVGRKSPYSLYDPVIASFEDDKGLYNQADAGGFIKLQALRLRTLGVNRHKMV